MRFTKRTPHPGRYLMISIEYRAESMRNIAVKDRNPASAGKENPGHSRHVTV
jgi:hypothetical protein